jgi:hypothetical protein
MKEPSGKRIPRHGYITELARMCNCSRKTVSRALFEGYSGPKSDIVRETYKNLYMEI